MLNRLQQQVFDLLQATRSEKVVFAESCSGGMAAALMTQIPGVSKYFCGSAVAYREPTKIAWLKLEQGLLHQQSAESQATSDALAVQVLDLTPEASAAIAITGHLGPTDSEYDGQIFLATAAREEGRSKVILRAAKTLQSESRVQRQQESATEVLEALKSYLMHTR